MWLREGKQLIQDHTAWIRTGSVLPLKFLAPQLVSSKIESGPQVHCFQSL